LNVQPTINCNYIIRGFIDERGKLPGMPSAGRSLVAKKTRPTKTKTVKLGAPIAPPAAPAAQPQSTAAVMVMGSDAKGNVAYCPPPDEFDISKPILKHLGGSKSDHWNQTLCNQIINAGWFRENMPEVERQGHELAILAFLAGVKPADTVEGMMAAQLYASHASAMECYRRAMIPGRSVEAKQVNLTLAAKLTKANATQVKALKKYRSKGQQKVIVEHVHVYQGGQAIVGNVTPGGNGKNGEVQPHAVTYAPSAQMRGENPQCEALPVSRDG